MGESSGEENANLYMRGVNEARHGEVLDPTKLLEVLDVFGEDGARSYLMGFSAERISSTSSGASSTRERSAGFVMVPPPG